MLPAIPKSLINAIIFFKNYIIAANPELPVAKQMLVYTLNISCSSLIQLVHYFFSNICVYNAI